MKAKYAAQIRFGIFTARASDRDFYAAIQGRYITPLEVRACQRESHNLQKKTQAEIAAIQATIDALKAGK